MTVNIILRKAYKSKDGTYPIVIRVEHARRQRLIPVGYKVTEAAWQGARVSSKHPDALIINSAIASKEAMVKKYLADCSLHGKPIHLDLIGSGRQSYSFTEYLAHRGSQYRAAGQPVMWRKVTRFVWELKEVFGRDVFFSDLTPDSLRDLDRWMIDRGNSQNTRHNKFGVLSWFYSHAMTEGKAPAPNPFKAHHISTTPVKKEKLTEAEIASLESLALKPGPINDARNLFLFSFFCKGSRFGKCVMLRHADIRDGRIYLKTAKGGKHISVKIHARLRAILDQYPGKGFVFPFTDHEPDDQEEYLKVVNRANAAVNSSLITVMALAGIKKHASFHTARHSFAFQMKQKTDSIHVISDALGHSDSKITEVYLKALDDEILDKEMEKLYGG